MISIIIPVFNEAKGINHLLDHLRRNSTQFISEIIVVDGGSNDGTCEIVTSRGDSVLHHSAKGRARQMNAGASIATGKILYFLHADSYPPQDFDLHIVKAFEKENRAGCFQMKFDRNHWWLNLMGHFTRINHKACRGGDQSLFVEKELFENIGKFDESFIVYEDNEIVRRLYEQKQFVVIKKWLVTSARLYDRLGVWKTQYLFCQIYYKKWRGATPDELYGHYKSKVS